MPIAQVMERPKRWDVPFCEDISHIQPRPMSDEDVDRLLSLAPFSKMRGDDFPSRVPLRSILKNDTRIQRYENGRVIVRQGDYGNSAFLILEGKVRVIFEGLEPAELGRQERRRKSWMRSLINLFTNPKSPEVRNADLYPQMGRSDGAERDVAGQAVARKLVNVLAIRPDVFEKTRNELLSAGSLFGELAALGRNPRAATVAADGDAVLLEIRWQGLRDLRKYDEALRDHTDEQYRNFGLASILQASPLLKHLGKQELDEIAKSAEFETYGKFDWYGSYQQLREREQADPLSEEPIIAEEGHHTNGLILIRAGFARLSKAHGSGERTFSYLGKGDVYGLGELIHNASNEVGEPLRATLRAVGYVDVVRIPTRTFEERILPVIPPEIMRKYAAAHDSRDRIGLPVAEKGAAPIGGSMMEFLVENRFMNGTAAMLIDLDRCTRCDDCVRACASGHDNNPRFVRHGPILDNIMVANACMHCADPVCMIGCPTGAIHRNEEGGEVVINDVTCIGCGVCAASCPYDNIRLVDVRDRSRNDAVMIGPVDRKPIVKATKCDLCFDHVGGPACERACPHDALRRIDMHDQELLGKWLHR